MPRCCSLTSASKPLTVSLPPGFVRPVTPPSGHRPSETSRLLESWIQWLLFSRTRYVLHQSSSPRHTKVPNPHIQIYPQSVLTSPSPTLTPVSEGNSLIGNRLSSDVQYLSRNILCIFSPAVLTLAVRVNCWPIPSCIPEESREFCLHWRAGSDEWESCRPQPCPARATWRATSTATAPTRPTSAPRWESRTGWLHMGHSQVTARFIIMP